MTNLPTSEQSGDLDNIAVTRGQFRSDIGVFLEFVAQALGGVTGNYTTQVIDPLAPVLQGAPALEPGATPPDDSRDDRIPSTRWVQEHGRYVGNDAPAYADPGTPADGMLWIDNSSAPYTINAYNATAAAWQPVSGVPSGTRMLFQQSAAPIGWTKDATGDNTALRVTTGSVGGRDNGVTFTTAFTNKNTGGTVSNHALTEAQMPRHVHGVSDSGHSHGVNDPGHVHSYERGAKGTGAEGGSTGVFDFNQSVNTGAKGTGISVNSGSAGVSVQAKGSGSAHNHGFTGGTLNLTVNYIDVIIAQKD